MESFRLDIWSMVSSTIGSLVRYDADVFKIVHQLLSGTRHQPRLVGVFDSQNENAVFRFGEEIIVKSCTQSSQVQESCQSINAG